METASVNSKGQVTIPIKIRQQLEIREGSKVNFILKGNYIELRLAETSEPNIDSGFGMLKSKRKAVAADFDAGNLIDGQ